MLAAIEGHDRPLTAAEVCELLPRKIGLATVYRVLHALAGAGLVHVFSRDGELAWRRCGDTRHSHLVCERCGLVIELPSRALEGIGVEADFVADPQRSEMRGLCGECARQST